MSSCAAPAGSPCRTGRGRVAAQYHTARFRLVPALAKALSVPVPPVRRAGSAWTELPRPAAAGTMPAGHVRIGYARASTVRQSLDTQTDSLKASGVTRIFAEKISTRAVTRPELDKAVALAREIRASGAAVTIVVHEHKRLGRGIELAALAEQLRADGIGLEFLTSELQGSHDPSGVVFTVLAALSGMEREYIRDRTLEGHESARTRGKSIGGAAVTDDAMLAVALHLRGQELSLRDIAGRLVIATGKKKGQHPSPATVMRMLREHDVKAGLASGLCTRLRSSVQATPETQSYFAARRSYRSPEAATSTRPPNAHNRCSAISDSVSRAVLRVRADRRVLMVAVWAGCPIGGGLGVADEATQRDRSTEASIMFSRRWQQ
jgi:DNA invertase Pin-like site-specific DNA recombinase